jgi:hypothetical protein
MAIGVRFYTADGQSDVSFRILMEEHQTFALFKSKYLVNLKLLHSLWSLIGFKLHQIKATKMSGPKTPLPFKFRVIHRYLGFFLAGIMAVYAISGIVMIFRDTDFLKSEIKIEYQLEARLKAADLAPLIRTKIKQERLEGDMLYFKNGSYNLKTGEAQVTKMELPYILENMENLHKATTESPLYFLNIFFGLSLLFFVISAFWMYSPKMPIFKKGMYFALAGVLLTMIMLLI